MTFNVTVRERSLPIEPSGDEAPVVPSTKFVSP